jgi:cytochrome c biogenesis protein CcmG/thiol:disulfide interchange protein DsbE
MTFIKWLAGGMVVLSVALAIVFITRFGSDPAIVDSPLLGKPAPAITLPRLDGQGEVDLTAIEADVVVVNFFASWCLPCREEQPQLVAAANAFAGRGVRFVSIAYRNDPAEIAAFLEEYGNSPSTLYLTDPGGRAAIAYGVFGIPETFFIGTDGAVVRKIVGAADALILGSTIDAVLAGEEPGQVVVGETFTGPGG